jgi:hypothetical protein
MLTTPSASRGIQGRSDLPFHCVATPAVLLDQLVDVIAAFPVALGAFEALPQKSQTGFKAMGYQAGVVPPDAHTIDVVTLADYHAGHFFIVQAYSSAKE